MYISSAIFPMQVYATKALGMQCSIVVPKTISPAKKRALELAGADLTLHGTDCVEGEIRAGQMAKVRD